MAESTKPGHGVNCGYARERRLIGRLADPGSIPGASTFSPLFCIRIVIATRVLRACCVSARDSGVRLRCASGPPHGACSRGTA